MKKASKAAQSEHTLPLFIRDQQVEYRAPSFCSRCDFANSGGDCLTMVGVARRSCLLALRMVGWFDRSAAGLTPRRNELDE